MRERRLCLLLRETILFLQTAQLHSTTVSETGILPYRAAHSLCRRLQRRKDSLGGSSMSFVTRTNKPHLRLRYSTRAQRQRRPFLTIARVRLPTASEIGRRSDGYRPGSIDAKVRHANKACTSTTCLIPGQRPSC